MNLLKSYMSKLSLFLILSSTLLFTSCEDVIDVDLDSSSERLVIDAEILWKKQTDGTQQEIKLSRLTNYYETETIKVSDAQVLIKNSAGESFIFQESEEEGTYKCTDFLPQLLETYTLEIVVDEELYTATEMLIPAPEINRIEQDDEGGFLGDEIEVSFFYNDPIDETNFYLTDIRTTFLPLPEYNLTDDDFYNGNEIEDSFSNEDLEVGDDIRITFRGISASFYNYMNLILETTSGNPFSTPPANIRGNIINQTQAENYALGYFRLSEGHQFTYTVE